MLQTNKGRKMVDIEWKWCTWCYVVVSTYRLTDRLYISCNLSYRPDFSLLCKKCTNVHVPFDVVVTSDPETVAQDHVAFVSRLNWSLVGAKSVDVHNNNRDFYYNIVIVYRIFYLLCLVVFHFYNYIIYAISTSSAFVLSEHVDVLWFYQSLWYIGFGSRECIYTDKLIILCLYHCAFHSSVVYTRLQFGSMHCSTHT